MKKGNSFNKAIVLKAALSARDGDEEAFKELFEYMKPAVLHARDSMKNGHILDIPESLVIGQEAVLEALSKFDENKSNNFWSYGYKWIRNHLKNEILSILTPMYIPSREYHTRSKVIGFISKERERTGRTPTMEEIALATNENISSVKRVFQSPFREKIVRPDMYNPEDGKMSSWDNMGVGTNDDPAKDFCDREDMECILEILKGLVPERTFEMILMFHGIGDYEKTTLDRIGEKHDITRQAVEGHIKRAMKKLRKELKKHDYFSKLFSR